MSTFLLPLHDAEPDFGLLGLPAAADLPAVRWKVLNLQTLRDTNPGKVTGLTEPGMHGDGAGLYLNVKATVTKS